MASDELAGDQLDDSTGSRVSGTRPAEFPEPTLATLFFAGAIGGGFASLSGLMGPSADPHPTVGSLLCLGGVFILSIFSFLLAWGSCLRFTTIKLDPATRTVDIRTPTWVVIIARQHSVIRFAELAAHAVTIDDGDVLLNLRSGVERRTRNLTEGFSRYSLQNHRLPLLADGLKAFLEPWNAEFSRADGDAKEEAKEADARREWLGLEVELWSAFTKSEHVADEARDSGGDVEEPSVDDQTHTLKGG